MYYYISLFRYNHTHQYDFHKYCDYDIPPYIPTNERMCETDSLSMNNVKKNSFIIYYAGVILMRTYTLV